VCLATKCFCILHMCSSSLSLDVPIAIVFFMRNAWRARADVLHSRGLSIARLVEARGMAKYRAVREKKEDGRAVTRQVN
jgi:uncharacterized membrane protein